MYYISTIREKQKKKAKERLDERRARCICCCCCDGSSARRRRRARAASIITFTRKIFPGFSAFSILLLSPFCFERPPQHRLLSLGFAGRRPHDLLNFHSVQTNLLYLSLVSKLIINEVNIFLFNEFFIYLKGPAAKAGSLGLCAR